MLPESVIWFAVICVVWGVSIGINCYTRQNTNFRGIFHKKEDARAGICFIFGPICALAAITMGLIHFVKYRNLHTKIFKPFRILSSGGRHQIALEKKRRQRELEKEEQKRLEAQNETISKLLIETELEKDNESASLAAEINERFDEKVREEVDEVVGPLLDAKIWQIFEESEIDNIGSLKDLDDFVEDAAQELKQDLKTELDEAVELLQAIEERVEHTNRITSHQYVEAARCVKERPKSTKTPFEEFLAHIE